MVHINPGRPPAEFIGRRINTRQHSEWGWDVSTKSCPPNVMSTVNVKTAQIGDLLMQLNTTACETEIEIIFSGGRYDFTGEINWFSAEANAAITRILPEVDRLAASIVAITNGNVSGNITSRQTIEFRG